MTDTPIIHPHEIAVLNAARSVLEAVKLRVDYDATRREERAKVYAEVAEASLFDFVSNADTYLDLDLSYEQIYNRPSPVAEVA